MLARLINLLRGKANKAMSKMETPEVLAEQALQELESNIKKVKEGVVASVTTEKNLEKQIKTATEELANWEKRAALAVQQNNDDVARQCLQKKQELKQTLAGATTQLEQQRQASADLKAKYAELEEQLRQFRVKQATLVARGSASDATTKAQELLSSGGAGGTEKWEQKIQQKEFLAEAKREMATEPPKDILADADVEDELAQLKAQKAPKLIVQKDDEQSP